jgi:hypothetical protein
MTDENLLNVFYEQDVVTPICVEIVDSNGFQLKNMKGTTASKLSGVPPLNESNPDWYGTYNA